MRMQLIPHSARDRRSAIFGLFFATLAIVFFLVEEPVGAGLEAFAATILFITAYVFPDTEGDRQATDYSKMIKLISESQSNFDQLKAFLEVENERVSEVQFTLEQLNKEKQELEPVISATRDTVDAILAAYHKKAQGKKWKDWILAFCLGVFSSLIAGYLLNLIPFVKD